ncbi:MAG: hypothetical protein ACREQQ_15645 [Candidatus Binatia bacterium]
MLLRIACDRCHLASLWTDDPRSFLATVCHRGVRCEATLVDEEFRGVELGRAGVCDAERRSRQAEL